MDKLFDGAPKGPSARVIAAAGGWSIGEFVCVAGPGDHPFEERHDAMSIAVVAEGSFTYRSEHGRAFLHPGALLLGNHGACYQCGHDHGRGDRCVSLRLDPAFFEEIAATAAGTSRFRFPTSALGAGGAMSSFAAVLEAVPRGCDPIRIEEGVAGLATSVIARLSGVRRAPVRVSAQDERRLARVLALMDASATERLDLARLAGVAAMSKFHFLRVFRRVVGVTPHQHLVRLRLRHAAVKLLSTSDPVTHIALESGFGDLSGFNLAFRRQFNRTPTAFRRGGR